MNTKQQKSKRFKDLRMCFVERKQTSHTEQLTLELQAYMNTKYKLVSLLISLF